MNPWIDKIFKPFVKIIGIDIQCGSDGDFIYHYCIVQQHKNQLNVIEQKENIKDIDDFLLKNKDLPICINISGNGILLKKNNHPQNQINAIYEVIPNVEVKQFYWHHENINDESWIAIAKINTIESIKKMFESFYILSITLGPLSIDYIKSSLKNKETISTHSYQIALENDNIDFKNNLDESISHQIIELSGEKIFTNNILSFSTVVKYFSLNTEITQTKLNDSIKDYTYKIIFKKSLVAILVTVLVILLINTVLFMTSTKKLEDLQMQAGSISDKQKVDSLQSILNSQSDYVKNAGWAETSKSSFYADRIAKSVENSNIRLNDLNIYPIDMSVEDTLKFKHQMIQISGISKDAFHVNEWKKKLEKENWVKKVVLNDFTFTNDNNYAVFTFIIEL